MYIVAVGQMLNELIDHIDVYETQGTGKNKTQRLVIYYKFVGYLDIDPTQCRPNYTADIREGVAIEYISCEPPAVPKFMYLSSNFTSSCVCPDLPILASTTSCACAATETKSRATSSEPIYVSFFIILKFYQ